MPSTSTDNEIPKLWFENAIRRLRLPFWAGVVTVGTGPFVLLLAIISPFNPPPSAAFQDTVLVALGYASFSIFESVISFYTSRYLRREISGLLAYAESLHGQEPKSEPELDLHSLSSTRKIVVVFIPVAILLGLLFFIGSNGPAGAALIGEIPFAWANFILATFLWTFGYSMYAIYKMGKLPIRLKHFAKDTTLGLKPFITASLNSTLIYFGLVTFLLTIATFGGSIPPSLALTFAVLYPLGLILFLLPLRSVHRKLVEEKSRKLAWLDGLTTSVYSRFDGETRLNIDEAMALQLVALDKIQRDVRGIRTWPFDTGIIGRLLAIMVSVIAILLSAYLKNFLPGLH